MPKKEPTNATTPPAASTPGLAEINRFWTDAGQGDQAAVVAYLKKHQPNLMEGSYPMALMMSSCGGHADIVTLLLDSGALVDTQHGKNNWTALMWAAHSSQPAIASLLLDRGARVDLKDKSGCTALMMAATMGRTDIIRMLVDKGGSVNDTSGWTSALINAATNGHTDTVSFLLENGADPEMKTITGYTALSSAEMGKHTETIQFLQHLLQQKKDHLAAVTLAEKQIRALKLLKKPLPSAPGKGRK